MCRRFKGSIHLVNIVSQSQGYLLHHGSGEDLHPGIVEIPFDSILLGPQRGKPLTLVPQPQKHSRHPGQ